MPTSTKSPVHLYVSILEPWTRMAMSSPAVAAMRLNMLPLLWLTEPMQASRETQRMYSEKQAAFQETGLAIAQAPLQFWFDAMAACLSASPQTAIARAMINSSRRMARPASRRVRANQKRLTSHSLHN